MSAKVQSGECNRKGGGALRGPVRPQALSSHFFPNSHLIGALQWCRSYSAVSSTSTNSEREVRCLTGGRLVDHVHTSQSHSHSGGRRRAAYRSAHGGDGRLWRGENDVHRSHHRDARGRSLTCTSESHSCRTRAHPAHGARTCGCLLARSVTTAERGDAAGF
jgi:hypothetical protein